jgi:hypothetical protein
LAFDLEKWRPKSYLRRVFQFGKKKLGRKSAQLEHFDEKIFNAERHWRSA